MSNKKVKILEFGFCWHLSLEFISETITDRGNHQHTAESYPPNQTKEKNTSKLDEKFHILYKYL